jgi:hypothetical protein
MTHSKAAYLTQDRDSVPRTGAGRSIRTTVIRFVLAAGVLALLGCNRGPALPNSNAFQSAAPELKGRWTTAYAAAQTNGYLLAYSTLQTLRAETNLNAQQIQAVDELIGVVGTRMLNAANKGDSEAVKALQQVQSMSRRR